MAKILIADDETNLLYSLRLGLRSEEIEVVTVSSGREAIQRVQSERPDTVVLDVRLPDMNGLDVFNAIREIDPKLPVIIFTAFAATDTAIEAMKRGAFEYLTKPVDLNQLQEVIDRALELRSMQSVPTFFDRSVEPTGDTEGDQIVGLSPAMQEVYKQIGRIAPQDVTVLILGESGTGKELAARAIFQHSSRADKPFLVINCAAIPESLLESELFGHEKGAFTGADRKRIGKFEQAQGGTIFLDEIGDMTPATQAKVLRLLQMQQFERIGGNETMTVDVRVVAATNRRLDEMVVAGTFREDLLYRLNGFTMTMPPLRERTEDIPLLVAHFLRMANRKLQKSVQTITQDAMKLIEAHPWPGNVRELQSTVRYAVVQAVGDVITPDCLPTAIRSPGTTSAVVKTGEIEALVRQLLDMGDHDIYRTVLKSVDRIVLETVLNHVNGNQVQASDRLGLSRTTLRAKLHDVNLTVEKHVRVDHPPS
jgi:two-component system nitrogen regulation response regulator GlnG